MVRNVLTLVVSVLGLSASVDAAPVELRVLGWNLEGNGQASMSFIREQLRAKDGVHLWGLSEVRPGRANDYLAAVGADEPGTFQSILGTTGGGIRLQILYDRDKLELLAHRELTEEFGGLADIERQRAPLVARFRGRTSGQPFFFVVNHLQRGDAALRHRQASALRDWAMRQQEPVIMVGDYNFDYHIFRGDAGNRDRGYNNLTEGGFVQWVRPLALVKTEDNARYTTVLDFVFVANPPLGWTGESRILKRTGDRVADTLGFVDDDVTMDHRPVDAVFVLPDRVASDAVGTPRRDGRTRDEQIAAILQRLDQLSAEMEQLRREVRTLQERP